jgi:hypothetical protein
MAVNFNNIKIQGVSFNAILNTDIGVFNCWSDEHNLSFAGSIKTGELTNVESFVEELIKRSPIEKKSIIKTNVYLKNTLEDCDGDAFDKLVNVVVSKHDFDGFLDVFAKDDNKSYIIPIDNIELIEKIYEPIFINL